MTNRKSRARDTFFIDHQRAAAVLFEPVSVHRAQAILRSSPRDDMRRLHIDNVCQNDRGDARDAKPYSHYRTGSELHAVNETAFETDWTPTTPLCEIGKVGPDSRGALLDVQLGVKAHRLDRAVVQG